mgnify:CR=1 FL=1
MSESPTTLPRQWRYGVFPDAAGMRVVSLGRVDLPIGEALRLEMVSAEPGAEDVVCVQFYITTEAGDWALWLSCPRGELAGLEALERRLDPLNRPGRELQHREADAPLLGIQGVFLEVQHARRRGRQAVPEDLFARPENGVLLAEQPLELSMSCAIWASSSMNQGGHDTLPSCAFPNC